MTTQLSDLLFGDVPLDQWPSNLDRSTQSEPLRSFVEARQAIESGDRARAISLWKQITQRLDVESRHTLQAWYFLRLAGENPPDDQNKRLLGVVLEVPVETGCDYLAAYPDGKARYLNYTGSATIWEHPNDSLDEEIGALLRTGQSILNHIGPWTNPRRGIPPVGHIRINLLSPAGLHFGEGPFETMAHDAIAQPTVSAGIALMKKLVECRK